MILDKYRMRQEKTNLPQIEIGDMTNIKYISKGKKDGKDVNTTRNFNGRIISMTNKKEMSSIEVLRTNSDAGLRVIRRFYLHAPTLIEVKILSSSHVRRAKLYYLEKLHGKSTRLHLKLPSTRKTTENS